MKSIRKYPELKKVWAASVISVFGDSLDSIAMMWIAYKLTGSPAMMSLTMIVNMIPNILFGSFFGVLVDNYKKKPIIVLSQSMRALLVALIATLYHFNTLQVWHILIITFLVSTFETLSSPAEISLFEKLVRDKEDMMELQSGKSSFLEVSKLIGFSLAGVIIGTFGLSTVIYIDAITFILSALIISRTTVPVSKKENQGIESLKGKFWSEYKSGLKLILSNRLIKFIILLGILANAFVSPINLLAPIYSDKILNMGAKGVSIISISIMLGVLIGSVFISKNSKKIEIKKLIVFSFIIVALGLMILATIYNIVATCIGTLLIGAAISGVNTAVGTLLTTRCDGEFLGRVGAVMNSIMLASSPISIGIIGLVGEAVSIPLIFMVMGLGIILVAIYVGTIKYIDEEVEVGVEGAL